MRLELTWVTWALETPEQEFMQIYPIFNKGEEERHG
jgi:hypothetical protein